MTPEQQALRTTKVTLTVILDLVEAGKIGRIRVMPNSIVKQIQFTLEQVERAITHDT